MPRNRTVRPLIAHPDDPLITLVPLTRGYVALIDTADADLVGQHNWQALVTRTNVYAVRTLYPSMKKETLHVSLLQPPKNKEVDHKDGNGLDCRRQNLRIATHQQNQWNGPLRRDNTSGYKGVQAEKRSGRWKATIVKSGRVIYIGSYATPQEAARAYDAAARLLHGEFARLNMPDN